MAPPSSHRVEDPFDDESNQEASSNRDQERERASPRNHRQPSNQQYPPPSQHPYGLPSHYGNPMMYYPPHANPHDPRCHYCVPVYSHHQGYGHESREQLTPYNAPPREAQGHSGHQGMPNHQVVQPHYVAVNVQNDVKQSQAQRQDQAATNKQVSLKQKVIHNTTKALDSILDKKVLLAALAAFVTPRLLHHLQAASEKKKRKGITLNLGFGGF